MKIGILETGRPPEELAGAYPDYPAMFADLLAAPDLTFRPYAVLDGELPASVTEADGWLITGSRHGVYEDHDWIAPLKAFIREIDAAGQPLVGICFGHQIMAEALGGRAEKYDGGWALGAHEYRGSDGQVHRLNAFHQDQVTEVPPGAEVIASSPFCQYAALRYRGNMVSLQPHPEFAADYLAALLDLRRGIFPPGMADNSPPVPDQSAATAWATALIHGALRAKSS